MARVFITGSSDGLGLMAAQRFAGAGSRSGRTCAQRSAGRAYRRLLPGAEAVLVGELASLSETPALAEVANRLGTFDAVIHNAAIGYKEHKRRLTKDGLPEVFQINTLAPYILSALMHRPGRLIYVSSELHKRGAQDLTDLLWEDRSWNGTRVYSDTKFHDVLLAFAFARLWPKTLSNAMEPGWVPTKMGGTNATGDLDQGFRTQAWLAVSGESDAKVTGEYFYHFKQRKPSAATRDEALQDMLLSVCARLSGVALPTT